jgi:uncharacterized integral membrane protein
MKTTFKKWSGVVIAIVLIIIIFQNVEPVITQLLFVSIKMPRAALLVITLAIGFFLGQVFTFNFNRRQ